MDPSPKKKKLKLDERSEAGSPSEYSKPEPSDKDISIAKKKKNFVIACEQTSRNAYFDYRSRLLLVYIPPCVENKACNYNDEVQCTNLEQISQSAEEAFFIECRAFTWLEALEVSQLCITPTNYLSANILKTIVEIILNAHTDTYSDFSIPYLINKCQQVLSLNFSTHPPCLTKKLRICYQNFLSSPMDEAEKPYSDRHNFECDKGIVVYCLNRLEYEISSNSKDGPIFDKMRDVPKSKTTGIKGLYWQKKSTDIYEALDRPERIERLMFVLQALIEPLQFDLALWLSRHTDNLESYALTTNRPLMAFIIWGDNIIYTGTVNKFCRKFLALFANIVHLKYPDNHIKIMTTWLNTIIQTYYICETDSNVDYPTVKHCCTVFSDEFYNIISDLPEESVIRIIEKIQPSYMRYLIGMNHLNKKFSLKGECILTCFTIFVKEYKWKAYPKLDGNIVTSEDNIFEPRITKDKLKYLTNICQSWKSKETPMEIDDNECSIYAKLEHEIVEPNSIKTQNNVVHTLYTTLKAFIDAYNVLNFQETWGLLNDQPNEEGNSNEKLKSEESESMDYSVTETLVKKYRFIYQMLKELVILLQEMKTKNELPETFDIFKKIGLFDF